MQAPPDLLRTVAWGSLLYDSSDSSRELGVTYHSTEESFREAVSYIQGSMASVRSGSSD